MRNLLYLFTQFRFILLGAFVSMSAPGQADGNAVFALTNSHHFKRRLWYSLLFLDNCSYLDLSIGGIDG